jgi:hypothetical protein
MTMTNEPITPEARAAVERLLDAGPTTEAIINIKSAIRVIAPIWEWANRRKWSMADDLAGAQADLEQAIRFLTGEEEPS